jgi:hypothetical protein
MNARLRRQRNEFLVFLAGTYVSLLCAVPIVMGNLAAAQRVRAEASPYSVTFEQLDRNRDGFVDRSEAQPFGALDAVFHRADLHARGRLDKVEFARALGMITDRARR